ncbi:MAG: ADP-ribosylglycohydrolase family protein [Planctomycetota bacterium]
MRDVPIPFEKRNLACELEQLEDEGRETSSVKAEFRRLRRRKMTNPKARAAAGEFLLKAENLPMRTDYPYVEPSDLEGIRGERPRGRRRLKLGLSDRALLDRLYGAWLGRCAGCLLGKPVEGIRSGQLWPYLEATNQFPLRDYISPDAPTVTFRECGIDERRQKRLRIPFDAGCMPEDDDTNYTVTGLAIVKQHGRRFTPENVGDFWLQNIPYYHVCTAENIAYRNMVNAIKPPRSATYMNPCREWIGAQIRADFFGYVAVGRPDLAAEFAWRDASISHVKNGIYGEMWVAGMLAAAPAFDDPAEVIEVGLAQVPAKCRLAEAVRSVMERHHEGVSAEEMEADIHRRWDETNRHHWVHTISNAEIVTMGLLWGEGDLGRSIGTAVQACFDTDCNGATVGSIVGMMLGAKKMPAKWTDPLNDTLRTGVAGYHSVRISELAEETLRLHKEIVGS